MRRAPIAPPPPCVSRPPSLFPSSFASDPDLRPPCVASRRGERAPRVQDGRRVRVDGGGRESGAARPRVGRARAQRRRWVDAGVFGGRGHSAAADPYIHTPLSSSRPRSSTNPSARAGDASPTGARPPRASVAPWAAAAARRSMHVWSYRGTVQCAVVLSLHACIYFSDFFLHGLSACDVQTFDFNTHCWLIPASGRPTHVI